MLYNIHYDASAIVIFAFMIFLMITKKGFSKASNRVFFVLVIVALVAAATDIISAYYISFPDRISRAGLDFWNYIFLLTYNGMAFLYVVYVIFLTDIQRRIGLRSWLIVSLPMVLSSIALLTNQFHRLVFFYDETGLYTHGPLFRLLYADAFFSLIVSVVIVVRYRRALPAYKFIAVILCVLFCLIPIIIQIFLPQYLIEVFFQSIGMMALLFSIENDDEVKNPLTGAYNRFAFIRNVDLSIHAGNPMSILSVKVYNINYYNTTFGVQFMNDILREMTVYLKSLVKGAYCYDFYGGHFALVLHDAKGKGLESVAERVRERFDLEWAAQSLSVVFPAEICLLRVPDEIETMEQLMLMIDIPPGESSSRSQLIRPDTLHSYQREVLIERKIQEALEKKSFEVYYQPIWDRTSSKITSAEALVRLNDAEIGLVSPDEFIPIAERNGSIVDIGAFVLESVCRFYAEHRLDALGIVYMDVNLSVLQCMNRYLPQMIRETLARYDLKPQRINLEITESAAAGNMSALEKTVRELAGSGFALSLDDYGTGYSNYSYMFALPFKIIKIDKTILWSALDRNNEEGEESAMILLENTIRMLRQMQYRVVVEGVETRAQKDLLARFGCDYMQGYLFSKPLPGEEFIRFVSNYNLGTAQQ